MGQPVGSSGGGPTSGQRWRHQLQSVTSVRNHALSASPKYPTTQQPHQTDTTQHRQQCHRPQQYHNHVINHMRACVRARLLLTPIHRFSPIIPTLNTSIPPKQRHHYQLPHKISHPSKLHTRATAPSYLLRDAKVDFPLGKNRKFWFSLSPPTCPSLLPTRYLAPTAGSLLVWAAGFGHRLATLLLSGAKYVVVGWQQALQIYLPTCCACRSGVKRIHCWFWRCCISDTLGTLALSPPTPTLPPPPHAQWRR